jgi:hypothetical protein
MLQYIGVMYEIYFSLHIIYITSNVLRILVCT